MYNVTGIYFDCYSESYKVGFSILRQHISDKTTRANNFKTCLYYLKKLDLLQ